MHRVVDILGENVACVGEQRKMENPLLSSCLCPSGRFARCNNILLLRSMYLSLGVPPHRLRQSSLCNYWTPAAALLCCHSTSISILEHELQREQESHDLHCAGMMPSAASVSFGETKCEASELFMRLQ